jgi:hypothetical protein
MSHNFHFGESNAKEAEQFTEEADLSGNASDSRLEGNPSEYIGRHEF